jgi:class 3 adenylate cyclase
MWTRSDKKEFQEYLVELATNSLSQAALKGLAFYLSFMLWDYYSFPETYTTLWSIRLTVAGICASILTFHKHPLIYKHRRVFFLFCLSLVINSVIMIWSVRNPDTVPKDFTLPALGLVFAMSAFRLLMVDALGVGAFFCISFSLLLFSRAAGSDVWTNFLVSMGVAYVVGAICANVAENYLYKTFLAEKLLRKESERADNLLLKTFPVDVATELKKNQKSEAKRFENVTVMFCDIVNFTPASVSMPPEKLVEALNQTFSSFDRLTKKFGCEKIKTIGDAYMAVCGAPTPAQDHAKKIIDLALAIKAESAKLTLNGGSLVLRIGINSGPVVAGVIGESRFAYDLWGDTVNTASRMEGLAPAGGILITEATKRLIEGAYTLAQVPSLEVKGKGTMTGWLIYEKNAANNSEQKYAA